MLNLCWQGHCNNKSACPKGTGDEIRMEADVTIMRFDWSMSWVFWLFVVLEVGEGGYLV